MKLGQVCGVCVGVLLSISVCVSKGTSKGTASADIREDKDVLLLQKSNFKQALSKHSQLLVHFYAPLSGESLGSILEFQKAATELRQENSPVTLGCVDVSKEKELAKDLDVTLVPSLQLFLSGDKQNPVHCPVLKSSESILTWLKRREGPSADIITDLSQLKSFSTAHDLAVLGLFKDVKEGSVTLFYSVAADLADLPFAVTSDPDIFNEYDTDKDTVLLLRKSKAEETFEITASTVKEDLSTFIKVNEMALVTEYNGMTAQKILNSVVLNHLILFIKKSETHFKDIYDAFKSTATDFRGKVLFVLIDVSEPRNGRMLEYFQVRVEESPLVYMVNLTDHIQYRLPADLINTQTLKEFCHSYLQRTAKPKLQSEPIPEDWDKQPVKELVGMNFEKVAFNPNNNVLVLFYAPWNVDSQALFALWEELANTFRDDDSMVVARIDITANNVHIHFMEGYPSINMFPAVHAERMVSYSGKRSHGELVKFVKTHIKQARKDKAKEEKERKKYVEEQKAAAKEEL